MSQKAVGIAFVCGLTFENLGRDLRCISNGKHISRILFNGISMRDSNLELETNHVNGYLELSRYYPAWFHKRFSQHCHESLKVTFSCLYGFSSQNVWVP